MQHRSVVPSSSPQPRKAEEGTGEGPVLSCLAGIRGTRVLLLLSRAQGQMSQQGRQLFLAQFLWEAREIL